MNLPRSGRVGPAVNDDTRFFWEAAREHRLVVQRCTGCGRLRHPPGPACPHCRSFGWESAELSGRGTVYSYTVLHHPPAPGFATPVPTVVVEMEEGVRLVSNLDVEPGAIRIGEPVEAFFLDQEEGWTVPQFRLRGDLPTGNDRGV